MSEDPKLYLVVVPDTGRPEITEAESQDDFLALVKENVLSRKTETGAPDKVSAAFGLYGKIIDIKLPTRAVEVDFGDAVPSVVVEEAESPPEIRCIGKSAPRGSAPSHEEIPVDSDMEDPVPQPQPPQIVVPQQDA